MARAPHAYFPAFDIFRGVGIVFVVLAHTPSSNVFLVFLRPLGALGVHMFFALSGFLITYRLLEEYDETGAVDLKSFYKRRARRILPPAFLYLAVLAVLGPALHALPTTGSEIAAAVLFCRNLIQPATTGAWYTGHFWSLSLEEQFYLFWPVLCVALGPKRKRTLLATLALIAATCVWRDYVMSGATNVNVYRTDLLADHLLWGCTLALIWTHVADRITRSARLALGLVCIVVSTFLIYEQPRHWRSVFALTVAVGFILAAEATRIRSRRAAYLQTLGQASYDVYIWQSLFLPLPFANTALPLLQRLPWNYLCLSVVSGASFLLTFPKRMRVPYPFGRTWQPRHPVTSGHEHLPVTTQ